MSNAGRTYDTSGLGCGHNTTWNYAEEEEDENNVEKEPEFMEVAFFFRFIPGGICSGITMMRRPSLFLIVTGVIFRLGF